MSQRPADRSGSLAGAPFEDVFAVADPIPGWLTQDQARRLFEAVRTLPPEATVVEIGSHQGRSTVVLAAAREDTHLVAIDPFVGGKFGGDASHARFESHLRESGLRQRVTLLVRRSEEVRSGWTAPLDLVYVDGKHDARSTTHDLGWAAFLPSGGQVLVHDCFSSIGVTLAILWRVLPSADLRYVGRVGSLATFERARPRWRDRARILAELPWWCRNVGIKVLLRLRLRPLARLVGHHDAYDPY